MTPAIPAPTTATSASTTPAKGGYAPSVSSGSSQGDLVAVAAVIPFFPGVRPAVGGEPPGAGGGIGWGGL